MSMKIEVTMKRSDGQIEVVDMKSRLGAMSDAILKRMRDLNREAGRGYVMKAVVTREANNIRELARDYNNMHNEGGYGYVPNDDYFRALPNYREWVETKTYL